MRGEEGAVIPANAGIQGDSRAAAGNSWMPAGACPERSRRAGMTPRNSSKSYGQSTRCASVFLGGTGSAGSARRVRKWYHGGQNRFRAENSRRVSLPGGIFHQPSISRPETAQRTITQTNFELPRENNDVLPAGRRVPVHEHSHGKMAKHNVCRSLRLCQRGMRAQGLIFYMRLSVGASIETKNTHVLPPLLKRVKLPN